MHQYLRAIGFSEVRDRRSLHKIIGDAVQDADRRVYTSLTQKEQPAGGDQTQGDPLLAQFERDFGSGIGLAICGELDETDHFIYDFYYPYLRGTGVSTAEEVSIERHAAQDSYAGVCDELRVGVTMIFYLQNRITWLRAVEDGRFPSAEITVTLSALSLSGMIMMPIAKTSEQREDLRRKAVGRNQVIAAARGGDEDAIETLTLYDMDMYTALTRKARTEDIYTLVDTCFMPYGVECDQYSVIGEILDFRRTTNFLTREHVIVMRLNCNDLLFDVAINEKDLYGEPAVGRRFKGNIWMQGFLNFPTEPSVIDISL
ncbi:MAG: DUF3881 family protein [Lachnospiraceae bacterium]|nr:DUF3881 family protein [Lachnospiraceae bacterium]